jgi:6-pyruvoyltetrahydropterin/6-carboxytetrahydropterin synthase
MMYQVSVELHFDAAHYLRNYHGKCENLHGHRFKVVASIITDKLDENGLAYDFVELKSHLSHVLDKYDHACLNDIPPFNKINATSENVASTIYKRLQSKLGRGGKLSSIEVWESPQTCVTYSPSPSKFQAEVD